MKLYLLEVLLKSFVSSGVQTHFEEVVSESPSFSSSCHIYLSVIN